jgi:hypothetical protein
MKGRALTAVLLVAGLAACGVKAPPRASGAPSHAPPNDLFRPAEDPTRPSVPAEDRERAPAPAEDPDRPSAPGEDPGRSPTPAEEPAR